ncbi:MarR family transcriptional regulator [Spirillospora sp. NPDC047279]|uniref:MarR family winged helix-turn-helix transcriptional regulator n=1 Tax=Spirillospora sp. NPDC047279 TaxID=3155478 RepID=UPI003404F50C
MTTADDAPPARLLELPTWLISQTSVHAHRLLAEAFAEAGSRGYHYRLLAALVEYGPASQATLGRRTGIDRSDVVAALNDLADRDLIERSPDPSDRRRNIVTVTSAGREHYRRLDTGLTGVQEELLAPLSAAEREQLVQMLARVLEHHSGRTPRAV